MIPYSAKKKFYIYYNCRFQMFHYYNVELNFENRGNLEQSINFELSITKESPESKRRKQFKVIFQT